MSELYVSSKMKLYHASQKSYKVGDVIGPLDSTDYIDRRVKPEGIYHVEETLESMKPDGVQSRLNAIFAFACPEYCKQFKESENDGKFHIYEVEAESYHAAPMVVADLLTDTSHTEDYRNTLVDEYWCPKQGWNYTEYLCDSIKILRILTPNDLNYVLSVAAIEHFSADKNQAQKLSIGDS